MKKEKGKSEWVSERERDNNKEARIIARTTTTTCVCRRLPIILLLGETKKVFRDIVDAFKI